MSSRFCTLAAVALTAALAVAPDFRLDENPNNVVASRLEGEWIADPSISARLWADNVKRKERFAFRSDPRVADALPERYREMFAEHPAYMAGTMTRLGREHPFVLLSIHGNPHLLWFRGKDGDPFGDLESFNLFVARAERWEDDVLFVGGDFNNQPFLAYQRVEREGALEVVEVDARRRVVGHWETGEGDDRFGIQFRDDGTVIPFHDGRTPAPADAGTWRLLDDVTVEVDVAGARSTATFDEQGRLVWKPPEAVGHGDVVLLTPRHNH